MSHGFSPLSTFEQGKRLLGGGLALCIPTLAVLYYGKRRGTLNGPRTDRGKVAVIALGAVGALLLILIGLAMMVL